jgi:hypothetical protein
MNAFPHLVPHNPDFAYSATGMTLRDYFAGQALIGIITHPDGFAGKWKKAAEHAYEAADAMIEAREKSE